MAIRSKYFRQSIIWDKGKEFGRGKRLANCVDYWGDNAKNVDKGTIYTLIVLFRKATNIIKWSGHGGLVFTADNLPKTIYNCFARFTMPKKETVFFDMKTENNIPAITVYDCGDDCQFMHFSLIWENDWIEITFGKQ